MNYRDIIKEQMKLLPNSRIWWPKYFYHFTDIRNALEIIDKGWIYARHKATESKLMHSDNASPSVILVSSSKIKDYARLYFRPKTPTQYHNEGYKPEEIRQSDIYQLPRINYHLNPNSHYLQELSSLISGR